MGKPTKDGVASHLNAGKREVLIRNDELQSIHDQLAVISVLRVDERGRDLRASLAPLVSLKVSRIIKVVKNAVEELTEELQKLLDKYAVKNADGVQVPRMRTLDETKKSSCDHLPEKILQLKTPGNDENWRCGSCGVLFYAESGSLMLTDGVAYRAERKTLLRGVTPLTTVTITIAEVASLPPLPPGLMEALSPFIDDLDAEPPMIPVS